MLNSLHWDAYLLHIVIDDLDEKIEDIHLPFGNAFHEVESPSPPLQKSLTFTTLSPTMIDCVDICEL